MLPDGMFVGTLAGKGIESLPLFDFLHDRARTIELYHYTDEAGFAGLTAEHTQWLPSLGAKLVLADEPYPGLEDRYPRESTLSSTSIDGQITAMIAILLRRESDEMISLASTIYGPGWYLTDLPPSTDTASLLRSLWRGNDSMALRTKYWLRVRLSEFKVRLPAVSRPHVRFLPMSDHIAVSSEGSLYGQSFSSVVLVAAGSRLERPDGRVEVIQDYENEKEIVPPHWFIIEGWTRARPETQRVLLRFFGRRVAPELAWGDDSDEARAVNLLHVLAEQGDFRSAFKHAEELIEKYPDVAELWSNRGLILAKLGRRDLAIESYLQSITLDPTYALAWSNLSASLMHLGRFEEALCCANEVILNAPKVPDPWYNRASALAQISEWTAAAQSYQEFLKLAPKHQRAARAAEAYEYCRSMAARA